MHSIYSQISCLTLREIAVPGSHDAGMFEFNQGSGLASPVNTVTQIINIGNQLEYRARWFDIRPVISGGTFKTGHYGYSFGAWCGGNGQDMKNTIEQINAFTENNKELIILDLSHGLNTDHWDGEDDSELTQAQWDDLMAELLSINNRIVNIDSDKDVTRFRIDQLIKDRAAVLLVVDDPTKEGKTVDTSKFTSQGIFNRKQFPLYNTYANENNQKKNDSRSIKLVEKRKNPDDEMFALSWTLTQNNAIESIVDNAKDANRALPELLWPVLSPKTYPNILIVDAYPKNRDIAALAMSIDLYLTKTC